MLTNVTEHAVPTLSRSRSVQQDSATEAEKKRALGALKDSTSFASELLVAVRTVFGNQCLAWEPESFWTALTVEHDVNISVLNRNKLMAALTLVQAPRFYSDANVFEKTCLAFNDVIPLVNAINEASPAQMAWGVFEAELLMKSENIYPEFDYEPARYVAASLAHDGMLLAPGLLVFAQDELNNLIRSPVEDTLRAVLDTWERISQDTKKLRDYVYDANPVDVQLAKLASIELYMRDRAARYQTALSESL